MPETPATPQFVLQYNAAAPAFGAATQQIFDVAFAPSALATKYKLLIAMALDIAHGTTEGASNVSQLARHAGASEEEVVDAVKMVYAVTGLQVLSTGAHALPAGNGQS